MSSAAPFWILGAGGQVGRAWLTELAHRGLPARAFGRTELDLADPASLTRFTETLKGLPAEAHPWAIILTAAYTQVDRAELPEEASVVEQVNAEGPGAIARACAKLGIPFVHYSTDYVYSGLGREVRTEEAEVAPPNRYGASKLRGERAVTEAFAGSQTPWLIFRTSWVYDAEGKNFFRTMLRLFAEKTELSVVSDQWGAPTYAPHIARASLAALESLLASTETQAHSGVYHLVNSGCTSWHGFASAILRKAQGLGASMGGRCRLQTLKPIATADYPTPARRPLNSRLSTAKLAQHFGVQLPSWEEGLEECWRTWLAKEPS